MTNLPISAVAVPLALAVFVSAVFQPHFAGALGSGSTVAVISDSGIVCSIVAARQFQQIVCYDPHSVALVAVEPDVSFSSIAAGENSLCGIRSGGYSLICWDNITNQGYSNPKRIYQNDTVLLENLSVGNRRVCATVNGTGAVKCWRDDTESTPENDQFLSISSGSGFSCGILTRNNRIKCWGRNPISDRIQTGFGNMTMDTISAGSSHACGLNSTGFLVCSGNNDSGQLNIPSGSGMEFSGSALGSNFTCATRRSNGSVICWGGGTERFNNVTKRLSFESITSGSNHICGLISGNLSIICFNISSNSSGQILPFREILPGPCVKSSCSECGVYPQSDRLCSGSGSICKPCSNRISIFPPPSTAQTPAVPPRSSARSKKLTTGLLVFAVIGSVGVFSGFCTLVYCFWTGVCFGKKKVHNSVQPTITRGGSNNTGSRSNNSPPSRSSTIRRQGSRLLMMRRQRSGTSSFKHGDRAEEFSFSDLAAATDKFSLGNKIGAGSFGVVYRGKLSDGRDVAIKRGEVTAQTRKFQEKETAFDSELAFLSRLHHKHLVRLVGYCEENDERLLVYEFMKNGALYDHLHDRNSVQKHSGLINSWRIRIGIALDAARGIEYLHNYAVPPIIHRDIKSSNILLDANWTARVSDFGLSMLGPESGKELLQLKAAGTVGYIDPEYFSLNVLTAKSDVYGFGVVMLELLTGKRALFKNPNNSENNENPPVHLVDYAVSAIAAGELGRILDPRVGVPEGGEAEAVELVAYTAKQCVSAEGINRPTMSDIVANLERALDLCGDSHGSVSSGIISIVSE